MLILATVIALVGSLLGVYLSFFMDSAPAPTIVLLLTIVFIVAFVVSTGKAARMESQEMA
ncbi:ABC 3 transport family protein [compost metagenome]